MPPPRLHPPLFFPGESSMAYAVAVIKEYRKENITVKKELHALPALRPICFFCYARCKNLRPEPSWLQPSHFYLYKPNGRDSSPVPTRENKLCILCQAQSFFPNVEERSGQAGRGNRRHSRAELIAFSIRRPRRQAAFPARHAGALPGE